MYRLTFWTRYSQEPRIDFENSKSSDENGNLSTSMTSDNVISLNSLNGNQQNEQNDPIKESKYKWLYLIFCMSSSVKNEISKPIDIDNKLSPKQKAIEDSNKAKESRIQQNICNVNAIILLIIGSFVWGFFFV